MFVKTRVNCNQLQSNCSGYYKYITIPLVDHVAAHVQSYFSSSNSMLLMDFILYLMCYTKQIIIMSNGEKALKIIALHPSTSCAQKKIQKKSLFNNTSNIYFSLSSLTQIYIPNLSEYYEKFITFIYFFCSLKLHKYLNATLLKTFTFMSSIKIPSTMVIFIITF